MKIKVKIAIDPAKIMESRGMGKSNGLQKHLAARVVEFCDPYTPKKSGILKNTPHISSDGSKITYPGPYAHYQYVGEVYGPNVLTEKGWRSMAKKDEKKPTGRKLSYHEGPMRGPQWEKRMLADHRKDLEQDCAAYINGGATK